MIAQHYCHKILKLYYCKSLNTIELPPFKKKKTQHKKEKKNPLRCFSKIAFDTCILSLPSKRTNPV